MSEPPEQCKHKFVHLETTRFTKYGDYNTRFTKIIRFFCERCLDFKEFKQEEHSRETPEWYKSDE